MQSPEGRTFPEGSATGRQMEMGNRVLVMRKGRDGSWAETRFVDGTRARKGYVAQGKKNAGLKRALGLVNEEGGEEGV